MVCTRCIEVVKDEFIQFGVNPILVRLGEVHFTEEITDYDKLRNSLEKHGFEILHGKNMQIIEKIKHVILSLVFEDGFQSNRNISDILSKELNHDYSSLSKLFSEVEGITIEKFLIQMRIERVKELLVYDELTLTQIADKLNYSSASYLSNQFKKITGLKPSFFKEMKSNRRIPIDKL